MVYDAVGVKSSLPQEKEEDVRGQQKLTERDKEVVRLPSFSSLIERALMFCTQARWKLTMRLGAALIWVDACTCPKVPPGRKTVRLMLSTSYQVDPLK